MQELVTNHTRRKMMAAAGHVDLIAFEVSGFYDRLQRATQSAAMRSIEMVQSLISLMGADAIGGLIAAIAVLNPILLIPVRGVRIRAPVVCIPAQQLGYISVLLWHDTP